jgi:hypothetical protein
MRIHGIEDLTPAEIEQEVEAGGRFVFYEYCISLLVASTRRPSDVYFLRADDWGVLRGLPYCLLSLFFGWWGIPWGLIYTPLSLFNNLGGGCDVTAEIMPLLQAPAAPADQAEGRLPCDEA